jgi:hypothetical protein
MINDYKEGEEIVEKYCIRTPTLISSLQNIKSV